MSKKRLSGLQPVKNMAENPIAFSCLSLPGKSEIIRGKNKIPTGLAVEIFCGGRKCSWFQDLLFIGCISLNVLLVDENLSSFQFTSEQYNFTVSDRLL